MRGGGENQEDEEIAAGKDEKISFTMDQLGLINRGRFLVETKSY